VASDARGLATIERREPGRFDLQVWASGYEWFRGPIEAPPGELTDLRTVALEREVLVEGRVLDLEGRPLRATFSLGVLGQDRSIRWFRHEGFTSRVNGSFTIEGLGRKEYVIRTANHDALDDGDWKGIPRVSGNVVIDARLGPISGLELRLPARTKLVLRASGRAAAERRFRVIDASGLELATGVLRGSEPRSLALPGGTYRVSLLGPRGAVLAERSVTLGSEAVTLDLAP
jgi:hypothetical protein